MKKLICVLLSVLVIACVSDPTTRIKTSDGVVTYEDGDEMPKTKLNEGQALAEAKKILGDCLVVVEIDTGVKTTGGPLCRGTTVTDKCTGQVIQHSACDQGTLQQATVYTIPALVGAGASLGTTAMVVSGNKAIARTQAGATVAAARAHRPDQITMNNGNEINNSADNGGVDVDIENSNKQSQGQQQDQQQAQQQQQQQQQKVPGVAPPKKPGGGHKPHTPPVKTGPKTTQQQKQTQGPITFN